MPVKITNNIDTFEVTKGAFKTVFEPQGYRLVDEVEPMPQNDSGEPNTNGQSDDEKFVDEIVEKPVSEWTQEELKRFADINEISLDGVGKVSQVREIIANYIG